MKVLSDKNKRTALIGTVLFHIAIVLVLIFTGLTPPDPPRPVIGVEVNLGNSDVGMGEKQPEISKKVEATPPPTPQSVKKQDKVVTQEQEKTIKVNDNAKATTKPQQKTEPNEKPPTVDNRFVFNKNKKSSKGGSEGTDNKPGDKGKKGGNPNATNYQGNHGKGVSYKLADRVGKNLPQPSLDYTEEGTIVVKIWVNKSGRVTNAVVQEKGTNTANTKLRNLALEAAKKSLFNAKPDAPETQVGTIEYIFQIGG